MNNKTCDGGQVVCETRAAEATTTTVCSLGFRATTHIQDNEPLTKRLRLCSA